MSGKITYNGHSLNEFVPQRTAAYVSQQDWHAAELTVRESLEFSGRCQGVGIKFGKFRKVVVCIGFCMNFFLKSESCFRYAYGACEKRERCWNKTR